MRCGAFFAAPHRTAPQRAACSDVNEPLQRDAIAPRGKLRASHRSQQRLFLSPNCNVIDAGTDKAVRISVEHAWQMRRTT